MALESFPLLFSITFGNIIEMLSVCFQMNVPPAPAGVPTDGILVMEMKATLYRPLN